MLSEQLYHHLSFFARSLALNLVLIGDGFQLPPVERDLAKKSFSVFDLPADIKVNLTEVLRQALENPIIQIGTAIRTSPNIMSTVLSLPVIPSAEVDRALLQNLEEGGVVICHSNKMRQELNARIRTLKSLPEDILREGEPLLVTKNNYDLDLFNGEILTVAELGRQYRRFPVTDRRKNKSLFMEFQHVVFHDIEAKAEAIISPQEVFGKAVALDPDAIRHGSILCMAREHPSIEKEKRPKHLHATLGYAITAHKSQGSEWPSVLVVVEDSVKLSTQEGRRWLYTAITRSKDKVAVIWP
jgi:exodeoxyribonuclease-5